MALSTTKNDVEIEVMCPWCEYKLFCKIALGENAFRCSNCTLPFTIKIALIKNYEFLSKEDKEKLDHGQATKYTEPKMYP